MIGLSGSLTASTWAQGGWGPNSSLTSSRHRDQPSNIASRSPTCQWASNNLADGAASGQTRIPTPSKPDPFFPESERASRSRSLFGSRACSTFAEADSGADHSLIPFRAIEVLDYVQSHGQARSTGQGRHPGGPILL